MKSAELRIEVPGVEGGVSALFLRPETAHALFVLAHGAGAGMRHAFLEDLSARLGSHGVATLRYQFPYVERGKKRPDPPAFLTKTVRGAIDRARELAPELPLFAGGKSMGGRMTTLAASEEALPGVRGIILVGFPLHPAGKPSDRRAEHLAAVDLPMLFLQGTRDRLADLDLLRPVIAALAARRDSRAPAPSLVIIDDGDHSFHVLKRTGRTEKEVREELAERVADFTRAQGKSSVA